MTSRQVITGDKHFQDNFYIENKPNLDYPQINYQTNKVDALTSDTAIFGFVNYMDKNSYRIYSETLSRNTKIQQKIFQLYNKKDDGTDVNSRLSFKLDNTGNATFEVPHPVTASDDSNCAATTHWVNNKLNTSLNNYVTTNTSQTITGSKVYDNPNWLQKGDNNPAYIFQNKKIDQVNEPEENANHYLGDITFRDSTSRQIAANQVLSYNYNNNPLTRWFVDVRRWSDADTMTYGQLRVEATPTYYTLTFVGSSSVTNRPLSQEITNSADATVALKGWCNNPSLNNMVHKTGNEAISGLKTFRNRIIGMNNIDIQSSTIDVKTKPESIAIFHGMFGFWDKNNKLVSRFFSHQDVNGNFATRLETRNYLRNPEPGADYNAAYFYLNNDGANCWCSVTGNSTLNNMSLTGVSSSTTDTVIGTKGWVNNPATSTNVVHRTGEEAITGLKTFSNAVRIKSSEVDIKTAPTATKYLSYIIFDKNGQQLGNFFISQSSDRNITASMIATNLKTAGDTSSHYDAAIRVTAKEGGEMITYAPHPATDSNDNNIATTKWVNSKFQVVNQLPSSPDSNTFYFIPE